MVRHLLRLPVAVLTVLVQLVALTSCVHEFPVESETEAFCLKLVFDTDMTIWEHTYKDHTLTEVGLGETYDNMLSRGEMRYTVRVYSSEGLSRAGGDVVQEFVCTENVAQGYDNEIMIELPQGDYTVAVWADLTERQGMTPFYDASDFSGIFLQDDHAGNTDFRDAFRGSGSVSLKGKVTESAPDTLTVEMQRPLAKIELITDDVSEFIVKEIARAEARARAEALARGETETSKSSDDPTTQSRVDISNYRVEFRYVGYMPYSFNFFADKPKDSKVGVLFDSALDRLSENEASLGFDYVFVNGSQSYVTVQMAVFDNEGTQLSLTDQIMVPTLRNRHTVLRGMFLMQNASGGVSIDNKYAGDWNLYI